MSISIKVENISFDDVKSQLTEYENALIYSISNMIFNKTDAISEIDWDELQEAFFFDGKGQLHVWREDGCIKAVKFEDSDGLNYVDRKYELAPKYRNVASKVIRREYIDADEDGQIFVAYTRLVSVE